MNKFFRLKSIFIGLLLFFVFSFIFHTDLSFDQDLGRHIKLGEIILENREVPKTNLFSYTHPEYPFINHHFLFEVYVFLGQRYLGIEGLLFIKILILLITCYLSFITFKKPYLPILLPLGYIFLHTLRDRTELRPEIFSFLFTALSLYILQRWRDTRSKIIFLLPLIQLVWVNTHIYFILGFALQGIYLLQVIKDKNLSGFKVLSGVISASFILSLVNPNGVQAILYPLLIFGNYGYSIQENQTIFFLESIGFSSSTFLWVKTSWVLVLISLYIGWVRKKITLISFLLTLMGLVLSYLHVRSFPYLIFISLPAVLVHLQVERFNKFTKILTILAVIFIFIESMFYLSGDYYRLNFKGVSPGLGSKAQIESGAKFLVEKNLPQPIFNNFDIGSYISYVGFPRYKVFVDGRPEAYPKEFFTEEYIPIQYEYEKFKEYQKKYNFQTIIFSHTDQTPWAKSFLKQISKDKAWSMAYLDSFTVIFTKTSNIKDLNLKPIDPDTLRASDYNFEDNLLNYRIGAFCFNIEKPNCYQSFMNTFQIKAGSTQSNIWW